jgi:hypothetical protein
MNRARVHMHPRPICASEGGRDHRAGGLIAMKRVGHD